MAFLTARETDEGSHETAGIRSVSSIARSDRTADSGGRASMRAIRQHIPAVYSTN